MRSLYAGTKRKGRKLTLVLGVIVTIITAYVLVLPAISITDDVASPEAGFFTEEQQASAADFKAQPAPESVADPAQQTPTPEEQAVPAPADPAADATSESVSAPEEAEEIQDTDEDVTGGGEPPESEAEEPTDDQAEDVTGGGELPGSEAEDPADDQAEDAAPNEDDAASEGESTSSADKPAADAEPSAAKGADESLHQKLDLGEGMILDVRIQDKKGILPAGTALKLSTIPADKAEATIDLMKTEAQQKAGISSEESGIIAAEIQLVDTDGNQVQPSDSVLVTVQSPAIERDAQVAVVNVKYAEHPENPEGPDGKDKANVVAPETIDLDKHKIEFASKDFGPYAIVYIPPANGEEQAEGDQNGEDAEGEDVEDEPALLEDAPAQSFSEAVETADGTIVNVNVEADEDTFPVGTTMQATVVESEDVLDAARAEAAESTDMQAENMHVAAVDITFLDADGNPIEPAKQVHVSMVAQDIPPVDQLAVVHVDDEQVAAVVEGAETHANLGTVYFDTDAFSVYAMVYTVDFAWEADGEYVLKSTDFSIPGGGFVSLSHVMEVLGIEPEAYENNAVDLNEVEVSEAAKSFVADVESVEFSDSELVWVGKAESDTTVETLIETNGLEVQHSADLTEGQIEEVNAQTVEAEDWALISLQPFQSEETLTVTMKNGNQYEIRVTDGQISANVLTADGITFKITVSFDETAEIPRGTTLVAQEIESGSDEYLQYLGKTWAEVNKDYLDAKDEVEFPDIPLININAVRFFDVKLVYRDEEIEPKAPVQVEIAYTDGLLSSDQAKPGVVHFKQEDEVEILDEVSADVEDDAAVSFRYEQDSFSIVGTYIQQETKNAETPPLGAQDASSSAGTSSQSTNLADVAVSNEPEEDSVLAIPPIALRSGDGEESSYAEDTSVLPQPTGSKTLEPNEDGTYTLTLSVKGSSQTEIQTAQKKANVLFVMDRSSSMITNTVNDDEQFWYYGTWNTAEFRGDITPANGYQFFGEINGEYVELNTVVNGWRDFYFTYNGVQYDRNAPLYVRSKTTRLYAEQEALDDVTDRLLAHNTTEVPDNVEIAVISFADHRSDGKSWSGETEHQTWAQGTDNSDLMQFINSTRYASGTNWEEALQYAYAVISSKKQAELTAGKPEEDYYVVFLTDGEPTNMVGDTSAAQHTGDSGNKDAYDAAKDDAKKLVDEGYTFYNVFTFRKNEPVKYSKYLTNYAYGNGDYNEGATDELNEYFSDARTIDALNDTFNNIFQTIADIVGHANVSITDTLTTDAMTTTVVQGKTNGYVYTVKDPSGTVLYTVTAAGDIGESPTVTFNVPGSATKTYTATPTQVGEGTLYSITTEEGQEYRIALADIDDTTGNLTWDLSPVGILMNDCEYSVSFVVWPDQQAYDYVAGLNNHLEGYSWNDSTAVYNSEKGYWSGGVAGYPSIVRYGSDGPFAVLTNEDQKIHYSVVEMQTINGEINGEPTVNGPFYQDLQTPDPMPLTAAQSALEKAWSVERDPGILAQLLYDLDGNSTKFHIDFDIFRDEDTSESSEEDPSMGEGQSSEEEASEEGAKPYTTVSIGWDESQGKYIWEPGSVRTVRYNGHNVQVGMRWREDFSIATGLMLSEERMDALGLDKAAYQSADWHGTTYYILEPGHDYRIEEKIPEGEESWVTYEFDCISPVFHPMLVDGDLQSVNFTDFDKEAVGPFSTDENEFTITTMTSQTGGLDSLRIENTLRGYINLEKDVVDKDGKTPLPDDETMFEYKVELRNSTDPGPFTFEGSHVPWYGIDGLFYRDDDWNYYQAETNTQDHKAHRFSLTTESGAEYEAWCSNADGTEAPDDVVFDEDIAGPTWITYNDGTRNVTIQLYGNQMTHESDNYVWAVLKIDQNQVLNIANVPVGSTYEITETAQTDYDFVNVRREIRNGSHVESGSVLTGGTTVTGTIVADRDNHVIYTNKVHSVDLNVTKVDENGIPMTGAVFNLYRAGDGNAEELVDTKPGAGEEDAGTYEFINLQDGNYTLRETAPEGYEAVGDVTFTVENGVVSSVGDLPDGVTRDGDNLSFTVKNSPTNNQGQITVRKQWLDYNGNASNYDGTLDLTLAQWVPGEAPNHTVTFYFRCTGNGSGSTNYPGQITSLAERSGTGGGDVTIQWDWNQYTQVQPFDVDGLEGSTYTTSSSNDGVEYQSDGRGKRQTLTIHNITKDLIIYVTIRNGGWSGTGDNLIYQPQFSGASSTSVEDVPTGGTKTVTLGANGAWSQQFTVTGSGLLSDSSTELPATYNGKECRYTISEDAIPDGYELIQISTDKVQSGVLTAYNKNTAETGSLCVTKAVQKNGVNDADASGTFYYAVFSEPYDADASPAQIPVRTGSVTVSGGTGSKTESNLPFGTYYVYELTGEGGVPITNGFGSFDGADYTVVGSGAGVTVCEAVSLAPLTNNQETVDIQVKKEWNDGSDVNHDNDTITFELYQRAVDNSGNILRDDKYEGQYDNSITGSNAVEISDLPKIGTYGNENTPVTYSYYVVEEHGTTGYIQEVSESTVDGKQVWTITNISPADEDVTKDLSFTKTWLDENGQPAAEDAHDDDRISVRVTQRVVDSNYIPVTVRLVDYNGSLHGTPEVYYVPKGSNLSINAVYGGSLFTIVRHNIRMTTDRSNNDREDWSTATEGNHTFSVNEINSAIVITLRLSTIPDTWVQESSTNAIWSWAHTVTGTDLKTSVDEVAEAVKDNPPLPSGAEYVYTLEKNDLSDEPYEGTATGWTGTISELPYFKYISDGVYHVYYYSIDEVSINDEAVTGKVTSGNTITGHTSGYQVMVDLDTMEITNRKSEKIDIDIVKIAKGDPDTKLPGAVFTLRQLKDAEPTQSGTYESEDDSAVQTSEATAQDTGLTSFAGLGGGYYELTETQAPAGYVLPDDVIAYFKISDGEVTWLTFEAGKKPSDWQPKTSPAEGELATFANAQAAQDGQPASNATFTIENTSGAALPHTGGSGTTPFRLIGTMLVALAGVGAITLNARRRSATSR